MRMDVPAGHTGPYDICCGFGARFLLDRQILTGLTLLFTLASLITVRLAVVAKESHNTCEEIQMLQGVENTTASIGRLFSYPIPPFAFQGKITHYKVMLICRMLVRILLGSYTQLLKWFILLVKNSRARV